MPDKEQKLKVYLETSFVNYLTGRPTSNVKIASEQAYTRQWWETEKTRCDVFVSGYTINECEDGGPEYVKRGMEAIRGITVLPDEQDKVVLLARKLLAGHAIPEPIRTHCRRRGQSSRQRGMSAQR